MKTVWDDSDRVANEKNSQIEAYFLFAWVAVNLLLGILTVHDFGISFDEPRYYLYAQQSLDSYRSLFGLLSQPEYGPANLRYYGPSFIMLVEAVTRILRAFSASISAIDVWHFSYFILFQLTGLTLYALTKRWFSKWTAWAVLILFTSQPLLWGHAFMNPKDIPFMAFMVFSVFAGFKTLDSLEGTLPKVSFGRFFSGVSEAWRQVSDSQGRMDKSWLSLGGGILALYIFGNFIIAQVVAFFYKADSNTWAGKLFNSYAQAQGVPLEDYVSRAQTLFHRFADPLAVLGLVIALLYFGYSFLKTPQGRDYLASSRQSASASFRQIRSIFKPTALLDFLRQAFQAAKSKTVVFAGVILGLTISIRVLGPLAGLIVILCWMYKARSKAFPMIAAYLLWAGLAAYLTWPYLWTSPVSRFIESLTIMSKFPWPGRVLFNNHFYQPDRLPWEYLPVLLNIQLTEPLLLCFYVGFAAMLWSLLRKSLPFDYLAYVGFGFFIPLMALIGFRIQLYDNFRQILFILPGAFLVGAAGLEVFMNRLKSGWMRAIVIVLIAVPGIYSGVKLHPYEYVYYNSLAGGTRLASQRYETDYWRTSYRELALQVNQLASPNAAVFVSGVPFSFEPYARPDLKIEYKTQPGMTYDFEYAALTSRWDTNERMFPDAAIVFSVERDGAVLSVLKYVKGQAVK